MKIWTSEKIMQTISQRMLNECITNARLVELTGLEPGQVESSTSLLKRHGWIRTVMPGCYRITREGIKAMETQASLRSGPKKPLRTTRIVRNTVRERVWRAIYIRKNVSIPDLVSLAAKGDEKDIESNIGKYLRALENAGYLIRMKRRQRGNAITSNGFARWMLDPEKYTGPLAPIWRIGKATIYDPNTGEEIKLVTLAMRRGEEWGEKSCG